MNKNKHKMKYYKVTQGTETTEVLFRLNETDIKIKVQMNYEHINYTQLSL